MPRNNRNGTRGEKITPVIKKMLEENPEGLRYGEIWKRLQQIFPDMNTPGKIAGAFGQVKKRSIIYSPERGLWRLSALKDLQREPIEDIEIGVGVIEEDFYQPFAEYLENDLQECTKAIPLGGNRFGPRWGTPDVIGKNESGRTDIIKHEPEIISAEIKIDTAALITAFGQACAYKLFSHKVYIVIPKNSPEDDKSRIESLCLIFGIGLVFFNRNDKNNPEFEIRTRPIKHDPDPFYVNRYMPYIEEELWR